MRMGLRLIAFAIAVAALVDPAITLSGAARPRLAVVALRSAAPDDLRVRDRLVRDLSGAFEVVANVTSDAAAAVLIGDRIPDDSVPHELRVATVTMPDEVAPWGAHRWSRRAGRGAARDGDSPRRARRSARPVGTDERCDGDDCRFGSRESIARMDRRRGTLARGNRCRAGGRSAVPHPGPPSASAARRPDRTNRQQSRRRQEPDDRRCRGRCSARAFPCGVLRSAAIVGDDVCSTGARS